MAYPVALPYEQPTKLSAREIPFAVAGALVDCLTCGVCCGGNPSPAEEPYWPSPALPTYTAPAFPPGGSYETKAVFTNIPLREEAIRRGFIQPENGESPCTTLYTPPMGPPVRLVPVEAAPAAPSILPQYALQQSFDVEPPSLADAAVQVNMDAARAAEAVQEKAFVTTAAATPSSPVAVLPSYFNCELFPAATPAERKNVLNSPRETVRFTLQQQNGIPLQSNMLQAQGTTAAYQGPYVSPVIPRAFEVYFPNVPYRRETLEQKRYVVEAPPSVVSQSVDTVVEKEEERDISTGKKSSSLVPGSDVANSEKDPPPTNQTVSEGSGSTDNLRGGKRKSEGVGSEKEIQADGNEGRTSQAGGGKEEENGAGKGNGGGKQKTTPVDGTVEQQTPQTPVLPTVEGITKGIDVSDQYVFHQKQSEYAPGIFSR